MSVNMEKYNKCSDHYDEQQLNSSLEFLINDGGIKALTVCMEEPSELIQIISKHIRYVEDKPDLSGYSSATQEAAKEFYNQLHFNLVEEVVDNMIILYIAMRKQNISDKDFMKMMAYKIERLKEQIEKGTYGLPPFLANS